MIKKRCLSFVVVLLAALCGFCTLLILSGCSESKEYVDSEPDGINLSLVYSNRQKSDAGIDDSKISPYVVSSLQRTEKEEDSDSNNLSYVICDGKPSFSSSGDEYQPSKKKASMNVEKDNKKIAENFLEMMKTQNANYDECDVFDSISKAAENFDGKSGKGKNNKNNYVVICDSGLSTKGLVNFSNTSMLGANIDDFTKNNKLPNLSKIHKVVWFGFNSTCDGQDSIPSQYVEDTKKLYEDLLLKCGVEEVEFASSTIKRTSYFNEATSLPNVSSINWPDITKQLSSFSNGDTNTLKLDETQIKFVADSTDFVDETYANTVINDVADVVKKNNLLKITVNGYIASDKQEEGNLSQRRADTVKNKLVEYGCKEDNVASCGKGPGPYPVYIDGNTLNPANRFIEIVKQ